MTKVRVDFFRFTNTWYTTEEMEWTGGTTGDIRRAFAQSLHNHLKSGLGMRLDDMVAVCLAPNHEFQYPLMMPVEDIYYHLQVDDTNEPTTEYDNVSYDAFNAFRGCNPQ